MRIHSNVYSRKQLFLALDVSLEQLLYHRNIIRMTQGFATVAMMCYYSNHSLFPIPIREQALNLGLTSLIALFHIVDNKIAAIKWC